ncbi:coiled-coil domain-containing protein 201 [Tamandua tetradactyla]|uniref:coiled-coil domain-containing protein 201 n=1 Tax=Tamandua tetradactyla TaxID=48850 RepID=UPI004053D1FA
MALQAWACAARLPSGGPWPLVGPAQLWALSQLHLLLAAGMELRKQQTQPGAPVLPAGPGFQCGELLVPSDSWDPTWRLMSIPGLSPSEDEDSSLVIRKASTLKLIKHSTPEEGTLSHSLRPLGDISSLSEGGPSGGSPVPANALQDIPSQLSGVSIKATFRKKRLSTVSASEESSAQVEPDLEVSPPGEGPPATSTSAEQQQKEEGLQVRRLPRNMGLPGIPNTAERRRRDPKKMAAMMERVRQWEIRLLWDIEEATQHELTIQDE